MNNVDDDDEFFSGGLVGVGGKKFLRSFNQFRKRNHRHEFEYSINQMALKILLFAYFVRRSYFHDFGNDSSSLFIFDSVSDGCFENLCTITLVRNIRWNFRVFGVDKQTRSTLISKFWKSPRSEITLFIYFMI